MKKVFRFFCVIFLLIAVAAAGFGTSRPDIAGRVQHMVLFKVANVRWPVGLRGVQQSFQKRLLFHEYRMVTDGVFSMFWGNFITRGVIFFEDYIYAGTATSISVFDARDPHNIVLKKNLPLAGTAYAVALDRKNRLLYVSTGYAGLSVIDISNPLEIKRVGWLLLPQSAYTRWLAYSEPYVYVASELGCMIVNVKNPRNPQLVRQLLYEPVKFAWVDGSSLYLTLKHQRIYTYDITRKDKPAFLGKIDLSYATSHNEVDPAPGYLITKGNIAYVANGHGGLAVLDVSNPARPKLMQKINLDGKYSSNVAYYKDVLSVQVSDATYLFDISRPGKPKLLSHENVYGGFFTAGFTTDKAVFMSQIAGFEVIDMSKPKNVFPRKVLGSYFDKPTARAVHVDEKNKRLYLAYGSDGMNIYSLEAPSAPKLLRTVPALGYANGLAASASAAPYMFVAEGLRGVSVVKTDTPRQASSKTRFDLESVSWNLAVDKNYAYVCSGDQGLTIYDIRNPENPEFIGRSVIAGKTKGRNDFTLSIVLKYPFAYVTGVGGLHVYDISQPARPVLKKENWGIGGLDMVIKGNTAYIASYDGGIKIVDLQNFGQNSRVSFIKTGGRPVGLYLSKDALYVSDFDKGLLVYDIVAPGKLELRQTYKTHGNPREVFVSGNYAYVADWKAGLTVVDLKKDAVL